jgi:hypothetical protein
MAMKDIGSTRLVPLAIVVLAACVLYALPSKALLALLLWSLVSVPVGILIGHCVPRDD